jgi:hypothetical protein
VESISKVMFESATQSEKQPAPSDPTRDGMQIDASDEQPSKARFSIFDSCESTTRKITRESLTQPEKHLVPMVLIEAGMQIVKSEWHPQNAPDLTPES